MNRPERQADVPDLTEEEWQAIAEQERKDNRLMVYVAVICVTMFLIGLIGIWLVIRLSPPA